MMDKYINFEIEKNSLGEMVLTTSSKYADKSDRKIIACEPNLFKRMLSLSEKYNNKPEGCIGVTFTIG